MPRGPVSHNPHLPQLQKPLPTGYDIGPEHAGGFYSFAELPPQSTPSGYAQHDYAGAGSHDAPLETPWSPDRTGNLSLWQDSTVCAQQTTMSVEMFGLSAGKAAGNPTASTMWHSGTNVYDTYRGHRHSVAPSAAPNSLWTQADVSTRVPPTISMSMTHNGVTPGEQPQSVIRALPPGSYYETATLDNGYPYDTASYPSGTS